MSIFAFPYSYVPTYEEHYSKALRRYAALLLAFPSRNSSSKFVLLQFQRGVETSHKRERETDTTERSKDDLSPTGWVYVQLHLPAKHVCVYHHDRYGRLGSVNATVTVQLPEPGFGVNDATHPPRALIGFHPQTCLSAKRFSTPAMRNLFYS